MVGLHTLSILDMEKRCPYWILGAPRGLRRASFYADFARLACNTAIPYLETRLPELKARDDTSARLTSTTERTAIERDKAESAPGQRRRRRFSATLSHSTAPRCFLPL